MPYLFAEIPQWQSSKSDNRHEKPSQSAERVDITRLSYPWHNPLQEPKRDNVLEPVYQK